MGEPSALGYPSAGTPFNFGGGGYGGGISEYNFSVGTWKGLDEKGNVLWKGTSVGVSGMSEPWGGGKIIKSTTHFIPPSGSSQKFEKVKTKEVDPSYKK